jgi:hypothetical protein
MTTKIYGCSDDLIEIEGPNLNEEFGAYSRDDEKFYLSFSDGTLLLVQYGDRGIWRFTVYAKGTEFKEVIPCPISEDDDPYTDTVLMGDDLKWVVLGSHVAFSTKKRDVAFGALLPDGHPGKK